MNIPTGRVTAKRSSPPKIKNDLKNRGLRRNVGEKGAKRAREGERQVGEIQSTNGHRRGGCFFLKWSDPKQSWWRSVKKDPAGRIMRFDGKKARGERVIDRSAATG